MTNKELFESKMNALVDTINANSLSSGKQTIETLITSVDKATLLYKLICIRDKNELYPDGSSSASNYIVNPITLQPYLNMVADTQITLEQGEELINQFVKDYGLTCEYSEDIRGYIVKTNGEQIKLMQVACFTIESQTVVAKEPELRFENSDTAVILMKTTGEEEGRATYINTIDLFLEDTSTTLYAPVAVEL